jgi:hypothetical protein
VVLELLVVVLPPVKGSIAPPLALVPLVVVPVEVAPLEPLELLVVVLPPVKGSIAPPLALVSVDVAKLPPVVPGVPVVGKTGSIGAGKPLAGKPLMPLLGKPEPPVGDAEPGLGTIGAIAGGNSKPVVTPGRPLAGARGSSEPDKPKVAGMIETSTTKETQVNVIWI